jgi:hypothetical protein
VRFEALDSARDYPVKQVVWSSPIASCDATLLEVDGLPDELPPVPMSKQIPAAGPSTRLYVIGHPLGQALAFSCQDNELVGEGSYPNNPGVTLMHYRTATEAGSSGSPVFLETGWQAVALHHRGESYIQELNGGAGRYPANEGVALASIAQALQAASLDLVFA